MAGPGILGTDEYGVDPYGSTPDLIQVLGADTLNQRLVRATFSDTLDYSNPALLDPTSYTITPFISGPQSPTVLSVAGSGAVGVLLRTTPLQYLRYILTVVGPVTSVEGGGVDPDFNTALFTGFAEGGLFRGVAVSSTRVRLVFTIPLLNNEALSDPANYTVTGLVGNNVPVYAVEVGPSLTDVTLLLDKTLSTTEWYVANVGTSVLTADLLPITPSAAKFQYVQPSISVTFPLGAFSGEAQGGLFGTPLGLVFFSPALTTPAANSVIQVDEVSVCTRAYDSYVFPIVTDPSPLFTFKPGGTNGNLNTTVLWAPWPRLNEASLSVSDMQEDTLPVPTDGPAEATLREPWLSTRVALLNNIGWKTFDNTGLVVPPLFICADNLTPIPSGGSLLLFLNIPIEGGSDMGSAITADYGPFPSLSGEATLTADGT